MKDEFILGIHGFSLTSQRSMHNSGVALLHNGKLIFATDEERFSRKKNEGCFPTESLNALYKETGVKSYQISYVAMPDKNSLWQLAVILKYVIKTYFQTGVFLNNYLVESIKRVNEIKRYVPTNLAHAKRVYMEHHVAHAASAYFTSPWPNSTIITVDGMGDFAISGITAVGQSGNLKILKRLNGFYSPGLFYMIITEVLGFVSGRHEGKVTGLAAFGKPDKDLSEIFKHLLTYLPHKSDFFSKNIAFEINDYISKKWVNGFNPKYATNSFDEKEYLAQKDQQLLSFRKPLTSFSREDIASAAQTRLEDVMTEHVIHTIKKTGIKNLVLAGGVFANVKLNQKIRELKCVENVYIYPAMNDSGLSAGAALYAYHIIKKNSFKPSSPPGVLLGQSFDDRSIEAILISKCINYHKPDLIEFEIAKAISEGKIIAHFNGKAEYGPRALGNRSILVAATNKSINQSLNIKLNRTEFMPFAPVILEDFASEMIVDYKKDIYNSRFMTMTFNVTEKLKTLAPAIVHIDGTARPQVVNSSDNPRLYNILKSYYAITGIPTFINTSFNLHEEPIVNSPEEAIKVLYKNAVDILILNNFWINKPQL